MLISSPPRHNARGKRWTSRGRRNLACVGTRRGNGGITPPGTYKRRRDAVGNGRHDNRWRGDWTKAISFLLTERRISSIDAAVALALASFSNDTGAHVYPSQTTIGAKCGRSASVVNRSLAALRQLGLLEWDHRFIGPTNERPLPSATSNMYEFRLPHELLDEMGLRKRHHPRTRTAPTAPPPVDPRRQQAMAAGSACALMGKNYEDALAEVHQLIVGAELRELAMEEYRLVRERHGSQQTAQAP